MLANMLIAKGARGPALVLLTCFELYLRPGECLKLRAVDVVPPISRSKAYRHYSVVVAPAEVGEMSKIGEFDNALPLDLARHAALGPALEQLVAKSAGAGWRKTEANLEKRGVVSTLQVFPFLARDVAKLVAEVVSECKIDVGEIQLHRLRHAGASYDFITKTRGLEDIRRRGRWKGWSSLRRYEKGPRLSQLLQKLDKPWQEFAIKCGDEIYNVVAGRRLPLALPCLPASSSKSSAAKGVSAKKLRASAGPF